MAIIQNLKNSVYLHGNQNSEHFSGKLVSFWGLRPQTPTGAPPVDPAGGLGDFRSPGPLWFAPPVQIPSYATERKQNTERRSDPYQKYQGRVLEIED